MKKTHKDCFPVSKLSYGDKDILRISKSIRYWTNIQKSCLIYGTTQNRYIGCILDV